MLADKSLETRHKIRSITIMINNEALYTYLTELSAKKYSTEITLLPAIRFPWEPKDFFFRTPWIGKHARKPSGIQSQCCSVSIWSQATLINRVIRERDFYPESSLIFLSFLNVPGLSPESHFQPSVHCPLHGRWLQIHAAPVQN